MNDRMKHLQPNEFDEIAHALVPQIFTLVKRRGFMPPLEVYISDSDDKLVCCVEMTSQRIFRNVIDANHSLRARFPIKISLTDRDGKVWQKSFDAADLPSLERRWEPG